MVLKLGRNKLLINPKPVGSVFELTQDLKETAIPTFAGMQIMAGGSTAPLTKISSVWNQGYIISGTNATATQQSSFAFGDNASATATAAIAMGANCVASGEQSFSWGDNSRASGTDATAGGHIASALGGVSIAIGRYPYASGIGSVAIGYGTDNGIGDSVSPIVSSGTGSIAIGYASTGKKLKATGTGSVALGQDILATGTNSVAIGKGFTNSTNNNCAIGFSATPTIEIGETTITTPYQIISTLAIGTAPLAVTSTTACTNLNADMVDGSHASAFELAGSRPIGEITMWGTSTAPTGWVLCDGASLERSGTYAALFAVIGTTFGTADGTHFNVPNLKGKVPVGFNSAETEFDAMGETGGAKTHTLSTAELASHNHIQDAHNHSVTTYTDTASTAYPNRIKGHSFDPLGSDTTSNATATNQTAGSGTAHNNLQPYITLNFIIKY